MNEWEMKYKALLAAIDNPNYVANAERIVKAATDYSAVSCLTAEEAFDMILQAIFAQQNADNLARMWEQDGD